MKTDEKELKRGLRCGIENELELWESRKSERERVGGGGRVERECKEKGRHGKSFIENVSYIDV